MQTTSGRPMSRANPARIAAARVLVEVDEGGHAEELLARRAPSAEPDRGLCWELALGVLRRRGEIDAALRGALSRPIGELDAPVRAVLRVGAFEALIHDTARYAVVDQAVETVRALGAGRASAMVNAVLRRVARAESISRADALNHPAWLVSRWDARYGEAATSAWCAANAEVPPLVLVDRHGGDGIVAPLAEAGVQVRPAVAGGQVVPGAWRVEGRVGRVEQLPGFATGAFWVQDAASAAVADLVPEGARRVLDACAAPGGKTFRLLSRGHEVWAADRETERLKLLRQSLDRLKLRAEIGVHDWSSGPHPRLGVFDAVLVDAPCTALGIVRRHPEIRWRRSPFDPASAAARQRAIAEAALRHVAPGGVLVYAVCSPEPEEGEGVVAALRRAHPELVVEAQLATAPPADGEDAFFAARLRRP